MRCPECKVVIRKANLGISATCANCGWEWGNKESKLAVLGRLHLYRGVIELEGFYRELMPLDGKRISIELREIKEGG
jgi:hypothetical protein